MIVALAVGILVLLAVVVIQYRTINSLIEVISEHKQSIKMYREMWEALHNEIYG